MNHGQALVGDHGFGVGGRGLREGGLGTDAPFSSIVQRTLGKEVHDRGAVNASSFRSADKRQTRGQHEEKDQGKGRDAASHVKMHASALLETKGFSHAGGNLLSAVAHV